MLKLIHKQTIWYVEAYVFQPEVDVYGAPTNKYWSSRNIPITIHYCMIYEAALKLIEELEKHCNYVKIAHRIHPDYKANPELFVIESNG